MNFELGDFIEAIREAFPDSYPYRFRYGTAAELWGVDFAGLREADALLVLPHLLELSVRELFHPSGDPEAQVDLNLFLGLFEPTVEVRMNRLAIPYLPKLSAEQRRVVARVLNLASVRSAFTLEESAFYAVDYWYQAEAD